MTPRHRERKVKCIAIKTHRGQDVLDRAVRQFGNGKPGSVKQINHIRSPVEPAYGISRVMVAVMESRSVGLERACQTRSQTATVVYPPRERPQILQLLRRVYHHQDASNAPGGLRVERVHIDSVTFGFGIDFIGDGIPPKRTFGFVQLARLDRKSTRLNSSHANISYAVF